MSRVLHLTEKQAHPDTSSQSPVLRLTDLPWEVLRRIMLFTMGANEQSSPCETGLIPNPTTNDDSREVFLNASNPVALRNGIGLAFTCHTMYAVFQDALTGVKLVSSWQAEQKTLIAACRIAAENLRAIHVECSAPVTAALKEVVSLRPPVRHFVLIGVNISKVLMADIIFYVGKSLEKLVISAAPSLDDIVVNLIADKCNILKYLELGGSRRVGFTSLMRMFSKTGPTLRGIELNSLHHESLDDRVLFVLAQSCTKLSFVRFLQLRWVTDVGLEQLFTQRGHQLTELRLVSCRETTVHALCILSIYGTALEKLNFSFEKGEGMSTHRHIDDCSTSSSDEEADCICQEEERGLSVGERALVQLSRKCPNLHHITLSDATISNAAMNRLSRASGKSLRYLNIRHCSSLGSETLLCLAKNTPLLVSLDISYLPLINDHALEELLSSLQSSLEELQIIGCTGLTDRALHEIIPRFGKRLRILRLSYCNFSMSAVASLRDALPRVTLCGATNCAVQ